MQRSVLVFAVCLLAAAGAWADPPPSANVQAVARANQRIAQHQTEVDHLQKDVGQQEVASHEAAERLQQQDRTIAELRQQLKAAQEAAKPPARH